MDGFLNLNKPKGITSFTAVEEVRRRLKEKKAGHAGNLDPNATGVLVIGLGKATRFLPYITDVEKEYIATIKLGVLTDTLDASGEVMDKKEVPPVDRAQLEEVLRHFIGEIEQTPPAYSAVKIEGKRLYELAREGVLVNPKPKKVTIYEIELLNLGEDEFRIRAVVSKGTYIRSLARDIAARLGTYGIVKDLVRTRIGHFTLEEAVDLDDPGLEKKVIPPDKGLLHMGEVVLKEKAAWYFRNGNRVGVSGILSRSKNVRSFEYVRVYDESGDFIGVGFMKWDGLYPKRVIPA
ncbi:MAG TPA: tRNA pseudouridine(55) synthase TruB [candidate division WOR-3 bacterium]|uniref:tRNA pseudouridine synthase B n=1 Tax=candidate division WOR-3 bacterium TaxID=2052148 RepID=A0A7C0XBX6_UNCW3|nr:tRNA pseudouridine(55) synthase TruB [candidate division WOR-3 bacterium]